MQYTVNSVLNYVESENPGYAILLNGEWGSGKTYFWNNVLKKEIKNKRKKAIYVSLYGISNVEEINKKIVLGKLWFVEKIAESKLGGMFTEIGKAGFGILKNLDIIGVKEISDINYEEFLNYKDTVLCFDDLERVNMSIDEVLGYINNLVEHDGIKVIIIGNEEEIAEKINDQNRELKMLTTYFYLNKTEKFNSDKIQSSKNNGILTDDLITNKLKELFHKKNEYKRIKEKLIGKTLTIQLDKNNAIENIIYQISEGNTIDQTFNTKLQKFLEHNIEIIEIAFRVNEKHNMRILRHALEDFKTIYHEGVKNKFESEVLYQSILKFVLAASFEIKNDEPGNEELKGINSNEEFRENINLTGLLKGKRNEYLVKFAEKYDGIYFFKSVEQLIRHGVLDLELLKKEIDKFRLNFKQKGIKPEELFLISFDKLSDEDFFRDERSTYEKLVKGEANFNLYYKAFVVYRYFIETKMVQRNIIDVKKELLSGLEKSAVNGKYIKDIHIVFLHEEEDKDLLEFKNMILKINNELKLKMGKEEFKSFLQQMQTNFREFYFELSKKYLSEPFFVDYIIEEFYENVIKLSSPNVLCINEFMENRIKVLERYPFIQEEVQQVNLLKEMLNGEIKDKERMTPRLHALKKLIDSLEEFENKALAIRKTEK